MIMAAAGAVFIVIMMMVVMMVMCGSDGVYVDQLRGMLDGVNDDFAVDVVPGGGDQAGFGVQAANQLISGFELLLGNLLGAAENDGFGALDLVLKELAKVFKIHFALAGVDHSGASG